jgi:hypothetical protein
MRATSAESRHLLAQQLHDLALALAAVADHAAHELPGVADGLAMGGVIDAVLALIEPLEAGHIGAHIAIGRGHHAGRPAHHMVAGEERARFLQRKAQMVRGVARRGQRRQGEAGPRDLLAIGQNAVRAVIDIEGGIGARAVILHGQRRAADDRGAGARG